MSVIKPINELLRELGLYEIPIPQSIEEVINEIYSLSKEVIWRLSPTLYFSIDWEYKNLHKLCCDKERYVSASRIGRFGCPALIALEELLKIRIYTINSLRRILLGLKLHQMYQHILSALFPVYIEVPFVDSNYGVVGRADIVGPDFVAEIKTGERKVLHKYQLAAYVLGLGKNIGYLIYKDLVMRIDLTYDLIKEFEEKLKETRQFLRYLRSIQDVYSINRYLDISCVKRVLGISFEELVKLLKENGLLK